MGDILKSEIKLIKSQRLDDTDQGGGQMTSYEVVSGAVNELFPDISRLDRVYGRVSLRKSFLAVQTTGQQTYYGSHAVLTKNASDPNVSVCFFSSEDWFDTREEAQSRIESYLVKGPIYTAALWGPHFLGTRQLSMFTETTWPAPEIGDVLVLVKNEGLSSQETQYVRVTNVTEEIRAFSNVDKTYNKKILSIEIGNQLMYDFVGQEVTVSYSYTTNSTKIYTTVAADASRYYGVSTLKEDAHINELQIRVDSINAPLVPSAQSQTAITDAGVGQAVTPMLQTDDDMVTVVRSIAYSIAANSKLYIGEGIKPGTFSWTGGLSLTDDASGNILNGSAIVGSITYDTGIVIFTEVSGTTSGTGVVRYIPACAPSVVSETGGIVIDTNNRGFVYVYTCDPLPKPGSLKVDFYSGGKWYSLKDRGDGALRGSDTSIGAGSVNFLTGSVSLTLGAMPDAGSMVLCFWASNAPFYNMNGETLNLIYRSKTADEGITRGSFICTWNSDTMGVVDNGSGKLVVGAKVGEDWTVPGSPVVVGYIKYATGDFEFGIGAGQSVPLSSESFRIMYSYGTKFQESFNPIRNSDGTVTFYLTNTPIVPSTFRIEWHTKQIEYYDAENSILGIKAIDPTHTFQDNGSGGFLNEDPAGFTTYIASTINYTTGKVQLMPDRKGVFPLPTYKWSNQRMQNLEGDVNQYGQIESERVYTLDTILYMAAAALWPTDGVFICDYSMTDGSNEKDYNQYLEKSFYIKENSYMALIPGSVSFNAGAYYVTDVSGKLFRDINGTTGIGVECGTINYSQRKIVITDDAITSGSISIVAASGTADIDPVQLMLFRTPGAPLTPGSLGIQATINDGTHITGTSNFAGEISGSYMKGTIDYETGIARVAFGHWVSDIYTAMAPEDRPIWYNAAMIDGSNIWMPISVSASTVSINCVVYSYLPLDSDLLGLDPVRLPLDGRVPIFRDGNIILIHHTVKENLPNPLVAGTKYMLSRSDVDLIEIYDSTGLYLPEISGININYTVGLVDGSVTIGATPVLTGFTPPFYALHRIEDMALASDVQITGHIAITNPLTHNYPANETLVSSVLPSKDLQSRAYNELVQSTWTGVWSDDIIGSAPLAKFDFVNYPIDVSNIGAVKERWLLKFKTTTTFDIIGEHLGILLENASTTGWPGGIVSITNRLTGQVYWKMNEAGFGSGWAAGNCIRFNTDASNFPYWFVRTTLQAPPTEPTDDYIFQIRGDSA